MVSDNEHDDWGRGILMIDEEYEDNILFWLATLSKNWTMNPT